MCEVNSVLGLGMVAQACDPSYSEVRAPKASETLSQK
jgi:hypothetical protein